MKSQIARRSVFAGAALAVCTLFLPTSAEARGRSTTVYGARGGVYQRSVAHTPGHFSAAGSATLPDGRTASRSIQSSATCTGRSTSAQATGFNGRTASYNSTRTATASGYNRQVNVAGPNGSTATKTVDVSHQNGSTTRTVTTTATTPKS